jgi:lipid II:glycine glycyltransferase (peptidoglycan interpeptide bridge formation enzyme)
MEFGRDTRSPEWDAFLDALPGAHFEQLSGWAAVKARYGWETLRLTARCDGRIAGGAQVLTRRFGRFGRIAYLPRGPAVPPGETALALALVRRLDAEAKRAGWLYGVCDHAYEGHALAEAMAGIGYGPHSPGIPPTGLMEATAVIDLSGSEADLIARLRPDVRRGLARARRSGFEWREGRQSDLAQFRRLMTATCARRGTQPTPPQPDYFEHLWAEMGEAGRVAVFVLRMGPVDLAAAFGFVTGRTLRVWKVGWDGTHSENQPNRLLWWEMMRWAKAKGFATLDIVGLDLADARLALRGDGGMTAFRDGTTNFKLGFGPQIRILPGAQAKFFNPLLRVAMVGGGPLLASRLGRRMLALYWARAGQA